MYRSREVRWRNLFFVSLVLIVPFLMVTVANAALTPEEAMKKLQEGNERYVAGKSTQPNQSQARRQETAKGQHPFATVLACSDSREPVEIIFDGGIGDIFVIRVAGNVVDTIEVGSIEYGVANLHTPVVLVLGHTHCGAVAAAVKEVPVQGSIAPPGRKYPPGRLHGEKERSQISRRKADGPGYRGECPALDRELDCAQFDHPRTYQGGKTPGFRSSLQY